jgi:hypothetical protein
MSLEEALLENIKAVRELTAALTNSKLTPSQPSETAAPVKDKPTTLTKPKAAPAEKTQAATEPNKLTYDDVKGLITSIVGKGKRAEVLAVLAKHKVKNAQDVPEAQWPGLVAMLKAIPLDAEPEAVE